MTKEMTLKLEEPRPDTKRVIEDPPPQQRKQLDGYTLQIRDGVVLEVTHPEEGSLKRVDNIIAQTRQLYGSKTLPFNKLLSISPVKLVETFKRNIKLYERNVAKAMTATYSDLDPSHKK